MTTTNLPQHIAIIMDGNGRWARHRAGVETTRRVVKYCLGRNIKVLSLFAFSSENWRRPAEEVNHLMELFLTGLEHETDMLHQNKVQMRFIGDRTRLNDKLKNKIAETENLTRQNTGMVLIIALDYGGQWDIWQAVHVLAQEVEAGTLKSVDLTSDHISAKLSFADLPDPDLFIRTSGELRISNFMLWQLAYSELYFTDKFWPEIDEAELDKAIAHFAKRERRFGGYQNVC